MMISLFKFIAVFLTEILNLLLICTVTTILSCLWNYVALASIAKIDNIYASSLRNFKLSEVVKPENAPVLHKPSKKEDQGTCAKILSGFWLTLKTMVFSIYFYFLPFATIGLSMLVDTTTTST